MAKQPRQSVNRFGYVAKPTGYHRLSEEQYRAAQQELASDREEAISRGLTVAEVRAERKAAAKGVGGAGATASVKRSKFG